MTRRVLDASVIVKALLGEERGEDDAEPAIEILLALGQAAVEIVQPPHWLAEVAGVLARLSPATAEEDVADLVDLELEVLDSREIYLSGARLAVELNQHLFDTLYHAVALELSDAFLITADDRYYRSARQLGSIRRLAEWR